MIQANNLACINPVGALTDGERKATMDHGSRAVSLCPVEDGNAMPTGGRQLIPTASTGGLQPVNGKSVSGRPFKPGQSGNPAGRRPGSRNRLSELLIAAMREDFAEHGPSAIAQLRERDPGSYLAAVRSMIPAHTIAEDADKLPALNDAELSDAEWAAAIDAEGNPHELSTRQARRNRAMQLVLDGRAASVQDAMRSLGADV